MRFHVSVAALAASVAFAGPAFAQAFPSDTATATARGVVLQQHSLRNQTNLDFGIVTTDGVNPGTVTIAANAAGTRAATNGVTLLPSTSSSARFDGLGAPLETVVLTLTPPVGHVEHFIDGGLSHAYFHQAACGHGRHCGCYTGSRAILRQWI